MDGQNINFDQDFLSYKNKKTSRKYKTTLLLSTLFSIPIYFFGYIFKNLTYKIILKSRE